MNRWLNTLILLALGLGAATFCLIHASRLEADRLLAREVLTQGTTVPAVVTGFDARPYWAKTPEKAALQFVSVRFTDTDGHSQEQTASLLVSERESSALHVGDKTSVVYLPHRTYTPYLKASLNRLDSSSTATVAYLIVALACLAVAGFGIRKVGILAPPR